MSLTLNNTGCKQTIVVSVKGLCYIHCILKRVSNIIHHGNVLFNDSLNTFYLCLYGVRHMMKYHTDSEIANTLLPPHGLLLLINSKGCFISIIPQTGLHIPRPLLHQSWSKGWNDPTTHRTMSERSYHGAT